jgi:hypothetical protein
MSSEYLSNTCKTVRTLAKAAQLAEARIEHVTDTEEYKIFRKRK